MGIATDGMPAAIDPLSVSSKLTSAARMPRDLAFSGWGALKGFTALVRAGALIPGAGEAAMGSSVERGMNLGIWIFDTKGLGGTGLGGATTGFFGTGMGIGFF